MNQDFSKIILLFTAFLLAAFIVSTLVRVGLLIALKIFTNKHIEHDEVVKAVEQKRMEKKDEDLYRDKRKEEEIYSKMTKSGELENDVDEVEIVDIVKPVGFWTSVILGQKLTYLVSSAKIMNKNRKKGFWVSMVEAQGMAAGRERGKGR
ncbi:MAG: hypothetical protein ACI9IL_000543 [Rickettsiales bacterium]|jgi:hypothetical protein